MAKESFVFRNLFGSSPAFTKESQLLESVSEQIIANTVTSGDCISPIQAQDIFQGELFRYKKSSKEVNISRWCILSPDCFTYYKNQFSALCGEKPLFSISTNEISSVKALSNKSEYVIELITSNEEELNTSPISTKFSLRSNGTVTTERHLMNKPRHLENRIGKHTKSRITSVMMPSPAKIVKKNGGLRQSLNSWTSRENLMYLTEERLIFVLSKKSEWEQWQKAFRNIGKIEVSRELN